MQVAISIGILRSGSLVELSGALNGARDFRTWAKGQGYKTFLITDEKRPVTVAQLSRLIKRVVEKIQPERLLVYFAGHGIQPSINTAYWLLSNWETDGNEAVNVNLSCYHAKRSGIHQIALFADACRATVRGASKVGGSSIFPTTTFPVRKQPQWDHFLATGLEEVAQEVPANATRDAYGIFTRCLLDALSGKAQEAFEDRGLHRVVSSQKLADYLEAAVPLESGKISGAEVQFPEVVPGWRPQNNYYLLTRQLYFAPPRVGPRPPLRETPPKAPKRALNAVTAATRKRKAEAEANTKRFASTVGRKTFETRQGLTIVGATPRRIVTIDDDGDRNLFKEGRSWHIRGQGYSPQPVLIELKDGNWIATCMFPEFVGTILVKNDLAASLNFAPALGGKYHRERSSFAELAPTINRLTALMHQGRYDSPAELTRAARSLRRYKHGNPSLGILAAYAYERAGLIVQVDDIARWFVQKLQPVPFDVALLASKKIVRIRARKTGIIGGVFPFMTQGWSFLETADEDVSEGLLNVRAGLLPSLWTTLKPKAGKQLAKMIQGGEWR